ncbi:immunoglobulin-like and fibronectin type III domain-containing protein 1 [Gadus morhua]|uniref:immunoglobulin-like and fibronectin type III domain-containing protein 1 n=1 Tax=Gadus morhua TaxID=8049 RepID=UPI0011B574A0|nr:immunoglobulin-like and fibronectin type III domain-containing protein 1 [Gadus morhua]
MMKKSKIADQTAAGQGVDLSDDARPCERGIRKKSKVPGVMITQFQEELPEDATTPDFTRKPIALTIQEGKLAVFKAKVMGNPTPKVSWGRANGEIVFHPETCQQKFDEVSGEHTLEFNKVDPDDADTYKCFATNDHGRAVCTVVLNVIEVGFRKQKEQKVEEPSDLRKQLKKRKPDGTREEKPMDNEEKVWEILLSADKKDYESICIEYGITNFRGMLTRLSEMRKEKEAEVAQFVSHISTLKHIDVKDNDCATIEIDMDLKDPSSKVFLYKDGIMVPFTTELGEELKHSLKRIGKKYVFSIKKLGSEDAGLYSVDVGGVNVFSTEFKVPDVSFAVKIQEVKAVERENAQFQCVLTAPMNEIKWFGKSAPLEDGEKFQILVSEDKLIHKLIVKDVMPLDGGIYAAVAGIKSCNTFLIVEADKDPAGKGKKGARKDTVAGGGNDEELMKIAKDQQAKYEKEMAEKLVAAKKKRVRDAPLIPETVLSESHVRIYSPTGGLFPDPGVHFHAGLSDVKAIVGEPAEIECKVSSEECEGFWYKDGEEITSNEDLTISKDGSFHRLKISKVTEETSGTYRFEADGRKTEAVISVEDPPRFSAEDIEAFKAPVMVKKGQKATFKVPHLGREPVKIQWYLDGEELSDQSYIRIDNSEGECRLNLIKLQRKDSGEVKIKLKNEFGSIEAYSELVVLDRPTPPMGPLEIVEASSSAVEVKWRAPKDAGGCKIDHYIMDRQQVGRNTWKKLGPIGPEAQYRDTDVEHGRRYCYRIRVETEMGISEVMESEDVQAGTKAYPGPPSAPKVVSAFKDCINLTWVAPGNTGGTSILGYNVEKRKKGSNLWGAVNPPDQLVKGKSFGVKDVNEGLEYEFRMAAVNDSGAGEFGNPSEFVFARDPKKPPGKVIDMKVTDSSYTTLCLSWTNPKDLPGEQDEAKAFWVEMRPAESPEWERCNMSPITGSTFTVKGMKSMAMYWVRVIALNEGGSGEPCELDNYVLAMPPPVRPRFTNSKIKSLVVVRAGNSARFNVDYEASPWPEVKWLKDGVPVSKRVTISNTEGASQLLLPSAERSDTGVYTIMIKNIVGQESFSVEIRVTDEPKPPGPVELDEKVPGTVTVSWDGSPDEKRDDRLYYVVTKRDSVKPTWCTVADRIFNNRFTACNIVPGREYQFRVYAKNDIGSSKPSSSAKWSISTKKVKFTLSESESKACTLERTPKFLVPLKKHNAPQGYECYMTCAVRGEPTPHITWLRDNVSLNTNTNYLISNTCGVCSLLVLTVGPKDSGEYKVIAENKLGRAECSTNLTVRD